jgi:hypothetical protein
MTPPGGVITAPGAASHHRRADADETECFFGALRRAHARAATEVGALERWLGIGGSRILLRFAGESLCQRLVPALEHVLIEPPNARPDLTVCLWDTASTGVRPPSSPWGAEAYTPRGEIRADSNSGVLTAFSLGAYTLCALDPTAGVAAFWVNSADRLPSNEVTTPLRTLLSWWAARDGGQLAHGAAVGVEDEGVLITGQGGSGKSTTALACLDDGMRYAGDDYVLLRPEDEGPSVYSLYSTAKLIPGHLADTHLGLASKAVPFEVADQDKRVVLLGRTHRALLAQRLSLRAILVPQISSAGTTALHPASAVDVLKALAPSTVFQLPGAGGETLGVLGEIVRRVPGYRLELGPDLPEIAATIRDLIKNGSC